MRRLRLAQLLAALSLIAPAAPAAEPAPGLAVHGRVLGPGGAPLAGAKVALLAYEGERARGERLLAAAVEAEPKPHASAQTAADGTFTLAAREAGFWTVRAEAAGHVARELDLLPLVEERELEAVELPRERPLEVAVVGPDGKPVAGAWVAAGPATPPRYRGEETWRPPLRLLRPTAPGPVVVPRGAAERLTVRAFAPGFHEAEVEVAAARKTVTLALVAAGPPVPIEVRDAAGRPVAGALVVGGKGRWPLGTTGANGKLAVPPPGAAGEEIHALAAGGRQASARLRPAEAVDRAAPVAAAARVSALFFTLPDAGPLAGRVLDAERREPLAGAVVWIGEDPDGAARTDRTGGYRVVVTASTWRGLGAAAPGYLPAWEEAPSGAAEERGPTFALRPAVRLRGRVVDAAAKTPLAGVEVRAAPSSEAMFTMRFMDAPSAVARTGADGRFTLRGLAAGTGYELHLTRSGYAPKTAEAAPVEAGAVPPPLELALDRGRRGAGLVVDQSERPVAGASVILKSAPARDERMRFPGDPEPPSFTAATDARGRYEIAGLPAGRYDLTAEAAGFAPREVPGIEVAGGAGEQALGTVVLSPGTALEGRVVDPRGQPIADAGVWITPAGARARWRGLFGQEEEPDARSAPDGWFRVRDLAPGQAVDLQVVRRGYGGAEVPGVVPPAEPVTVTLHPAVRVSGRVVDPDAKPIVGAEVGLMAERQRGGFAGSRFAGRTTSDEEGRFLFTDVDPGTLRVSARAVGRQLAEITGVQAAAGKDVADLELVLAPGAAVEGRVVDGEGRPVAGAWVRPVEDRGARMIARISASATADGDGWYVLDGLPTGPRSIAAEDDQGRRGVAEIDVRAGENRLDIRMTGGAEIVGRVVDAEGAPVAGADVMLLAGGRGWTRRQTTTGGDGGFRFDAVEDGEYRVRASKQGHATGESEPLRVAGAPVGGLEVRLQAGGVIAGRVLGLEPDALARVEVTAGRTQAMDYKSTRVDYEGRYRIAAVAPGEWRLWAEIAGTGRRAEGRVTLPPGASEVTLDLDFATGLTLSGRVVRGGGPVSGAYVSVQGSDVADRGEAETDRDGLFRIAGLDAGSYDVSVQSGSAILREKLALEADREVVLELAVAAVAGRVVDSSDRAPIAGATVRLEQPEGEERIWGLDLTGVTTDAQGRFRLAEVAAGRWRLRVGREGYAEGNRELTVREGMDVEEVEVALEPTAGLVVEVVRQTGGAPSQVRLAVVDGAGRGVAGGWHETGAEGRVRLPTVPAGSFEVLVSADGLAVGRAAAVVPGPPVRLALAPAAAVDLRVPALAGEPAMVKVTARGADGALFRLPGWAGAVQSDWNMAAGRSRLDGLPAGPWTVEARAPDGRVWSGAVTLVPGQTAELVLE